MDSYEWESAQWRAEVDAEAARLVRLGVPPWDAIVQARQRVRLKRQEAARASSTEKKT